VKSADKFFCLHITELFQDLTPAEMQILERRMPHMTVAAGRLIYSPDDRGEVIFILKEGRVRLYRLSPEGKSLTTAIIGPGSVFGEMVLLGQGMRESFAEAIDDCIVCTLNRRDVQDILLADPRVARRLIELISQRLIEAERKLEDFAFKSVPERLVSLLLQLSNVDLAQAHGSIILPDRYTHQQLAEMIGTYRETVTKTMNDLRGRGLIRTEQGRIHLLDLERLQEIVSH